MSPFVPAMLNRQLTDINGCPHVPAVHIPSYRGAWGGQWALMENYSMYNYMSNYMVIICSLLFSTMFNRQLTDINGEPMCLIIGENLGT